MRPLAREEIVPLGPYAAIRDDYRRAVIAHKQDRRLSVGPSVTLVFEDRETLRFQVQEMLLAERIETPALVQHELDVYNELMPGPRELSATLFVEITEPGRIRAELDRLVGIDEHVSLVIGEGEAALRVRAEFDARQFEQDRISAVQYVRFRLDEQQAALFRDPAQPAALEVDHPAYAHRAPLPPESRTSLVAGLDAEPPGLLPPWSEADAGAPELVLFEDASARILGEGDAGALRVESRAPLGALGREDWARLSAALERALRGAIARNGTVGVAAELSADAPARWRIVPRTRPPSS